MRGIFERPKDSGVWWISYFSGGKRKREKVGRKSDATRLYKIRRGDSAPTPAVDGVSVNELITDALHYVSEHKSYRDYEIKARFVKESFGTRAATSVTPMEIEAWLRKYAPATANRYKAFLSLLYREGMANGKVTVNPVAAVRHRREPRGRLEFISREQYKALEDLIGAVYPARLPEFLVAFHTGMRRGEQFGMLWTQVDFDRKLIRLRDTKNGEDRVVYLNPVALRALQSVPRVSERVFPDDKTRKWFEECLSTIGIENMTWHSLRHSCASHLAMNGASLKEIQTALGHKTIQMAARYAHLSPEHTASVVDKLVF